MSKALKQDLEYYMSLKYRIFQCREENGFFFAKIPDLPGCMTEAASREELEENIIDAKRAWLTTAIEKGIEIPQPSDQEIDFTFEVKRDLDIRRPERFDSTSRETVGIISSNIEYGYALAA